MNSSDGMLIVNVSAIQAVAIAAVTYYFGAWLRKKVPLLEKYSVPSPVVGGMLVALVLSCLEYFRFMQVNFDTSLQTLLMLAFFTTIGLSASLKIVTEGGKLLVSFLFVITILCVLQNFLGMGLAEMMGLDFRRSGRNGGRHYCCNLRYGGGFIDWSTVCRMAYPQIQGTDSEGSGQS